MGDFVQVVTIAGSEEEAQRIAAAVVEARLCACAQILGPIQSIYWWQGSVEKAKEWLCICKSNLGLYRELEAAIREAHSYDVPEILAIPVAAASADYLRWLRAELPGAG
jgi:periplasmic divalent cation tolerance protein